MKIRILLHLILWTLIFLQGSIQSIGFPTFLYKLGIPSTLILLYFLTNIKKLNIFPHFGFIALITIVSFISFLLNDIPLFNYVYFLMYITLPYFYFILILNEKKQLVINWVKKFITFYVLIQIPVTISSFILYGQYEGNAGTLTNSSGSVSTIFPSIITAYCFAHYILKKKIVYLWVIFGMFLYGLIGEKRAVTIFIPLVILLVYIFPTLRSKNIFTLKNIPRLIFIILISASAFYGAVRLNPTLNKEGKIGGSFDLQYFIMYSQTYNQIGRDERFSEMQRFEGFIYFNYYMWNQPAIVSLFGEGAGKLISSRYVKNTRENLMLEYYNVRYGGRMGFIWLLMQIGYVGSLIYLLMFAFLARKVWSTKTLNPNKIAFLVMTVVLFLDTLFYSKVFIRYMYIIGLYMFLYATIYREDILKEKTSLKYN